MKPSNDHLEILNSFPDAVSIKDLKLNFVWVNKTIIDILELPLDQIVGKKCYKLAYDLDEPCTGCPALTVVKTGKRARNEITTVKGQVMDSIVDPIFDENGALIQTIETSRNITDQRSIETQLSAFMKSATDGIEIFDSQLRYLDVNQIVLNRLGLIREDVIGRHIEEIRPFTDDSDSISGEKFIQVIETGESFTEFIPLTRAGSRNIRINVFKVNEGMGIISTDLSDLVESEIALRQSEERYRTLFNNSGEASFIHYIGGNFIEVNNACSELLGYTTKELLTMNPTEIADSKNPVTVEEYTATIEQKGRISRETRFVSKTGEIVEVELVSQLIQYQGRNAILSVARDIGERKQYEEKIGALHIHASHLAEAETLENIYNLTLEAITDVIEVDRVAFGLIEEEYLVYEYMSNARTSHPVTLPLDRKSISTRAIFTGKTQLVNDVIQDPDFVDLTPGRSVSTLSELVVPVKQDDAVIAVLNLGSSRPNVFTVQDQRLVETLASHIASAINRIQQTEHIQMSEERYRGLFDGLIDGFAYHQVVYDDSSEPVDYTYVEINDRFTELVGLGQEIIGKNVTEVIPGIEDDPADWIGVYGELAKNGGELRFEQYAEPLSKWYYVSAYSPKPGYFATVFQDITERRQIENALRESEALFRGFMQSATDGYALLDKNLNILRVNSSWLQQAGLEREDVIGEHVLDLFPKLKQSGRYEEYLKVLETGEPAEFRVVDAASGSGLLLDISAFKAGETMGLVTRDVSERERYQGRLEALHSHAAGLSTLDSKEEVAHSTMEIIRDLLGFSIGSFGFIKDGRIVFTEFREESSIHELDLNGQGITVRAVNSGETQLVMDTRKEPDYIVGRT